MTRARLLMLSLAVACAAAAPTTSPLDELAGLIRQLTTGPAPATNPTTRPTAVVDAAAGPLLAKLATAYAGGPLSVEGELVGEFDVAGRRHTYRLHITGRTDGNGRFVHDAAASGRIVVGDDRGVLFDRRRNAFATFAAPAARVPAADLEPVLTDVLLDENPALLLSLVTDPDAVLRGGAKRIGLAADDPSSTRPVGDGVRLELSDKTITLRLNDDGTIRSSTIDYTPLMTVRGAVAVKAATVTLTYTVATRAAPPASVFVWEPPATATEFTLRNELIQTTRPTTRRGRR